jgi:hypothetical protein
MTPIPTAFAYYVMNGELKRSPRYGSGYEDEVLPGEYALFYPEKVGSANSKDMIAKVFIIKDSGHVIKEFLSSRYGNNPRYLREAVEGYIKQQLVNPQQTLPTLRKNKRSKSKVKRKIHTHSRKK